MVPTQNCFSCGYTLSFASCSGYYRMSNIIVPSNYRNECQMAPSPAYDKYELADFVKIIEVLFGGMVVRKWVGR
jgi:hypothetical protein